MTIRRTMIALVWFVSSLAGAQTLSIDLASYRVTDMFRLPFPQADEASAVTFAASRGSLFVLGDEGEYVVEISREGAFLGSMRLTGFDDTEGLTYFGSSADGKPRFVIAEERTQTVYLLTYTPDAIVARSSLPSAALGSFAGNAGLEGISYDPRDGSFITVKERVPQEVNRVTIDFANAAANVAALFSPASLTVLDLADVQVLATVPFLAGTPAADNLLIFSQESARLLEVSRTGEVLSEFDFSGLSLNAEGVTIDSHGVIYVVAESSLRFGDGVATAFVLSPVPEPAAAWLLLAGLGAVIWRKRAVVRAGLRSIHP